MKKETLETVVKELREAREALVVKLADLDKTIETLERSKQADSDKEDQIRALADFDRVYGELELSTGAYLARAVLLELWIHKTETSSALPGARIGIVVWRSAEGTLRIPFGPNRGQEWKPTKEWELDKTTVVKDLT